MEQDPGQAIRFRLVNEVLGEYWGLCWLEDPPQAATGGSQAPQTVVELATWLKTSRPIPAGLLLFVERKVFLDGVKNFLEECEHYHPALQ